MPEQEPGEELDKLATELKDGEDSIVAEEQVDEDLAKDEVEEEVDLEDMEPDKLRERLAEREKELGESKKSLKESQSLRDRQYNAQAEEMAHLKGQLDVLVAQGNAPDAASEAEAERRQTAYDEELVKTLNEDPGKALPLMRKMVREAQAENLKELKGQIGEQDGKILDLNSVYKVHKDKIDALMEKHSIDKGKAIGIFQDFNSSTVKQPKATPAPGAGVEGSGNVDLGKKPPQEVEFSPMENDLMRMTGLSDDNKAVKRIKRGLAQATV